MGLQATPERHESPPLNRTRPCLANDAQLNANDHTLEINGLKFKLAHKRVDKGKRGEKGNGSVWALPASFSAAR